MTTNTDDGLPLKGLPGGEPISETQSDPFKRDFRIFLRHIWHFLGLGDPTRVQYDIAYYLQHGPDRSMVQGFRGVAKSWITAAYVLWRLYCDPQLKVLVVSASEPLAKNMTTFLLQLVNQCPLLKHLAPRRDQRQSSLEFDVGPARPAKDPSVVARGITGQITGNRAGLLVPDDVEVPRNSGTVAMRQQLRENIREFDAIIVPGGKIVYLGTPQTHDSIYKTLPSRGYSIRIWPALVPTKEEIQRYGASLAPYIRRLAEKGPLKVGSSVEPTRFPDDDLAARKLSWGLDGFRLQYMLDTSLTDGDRYPLRLRDFIVTTLDPMRGPEHIVYAAESRTAINDLPMLGLDRDCYYGPAFVSETYLPYTTIAMTIDPSGRGKDQTGWCIVAELNGFIYLLDAGGFVGGYETETLQALAAKAVQWNVTEIHVEDNFGDGMWTALFRPVLTKAWDMANARRHQKGGSRIEGYRSSNLTHKEQRIVNQLGAAMQAHRVVVSRELIGKDYAEAEQQDSDQRWQTSLFYQIAHLTRERGSLGRDDKIDAFAKGVSLFVDRLGVDPQQLAEEAREREFEEYLEKLLGGDGDVGDPEGGQRDYLKGSSHIRMRAVT